MSGLLLGLISGFRVQGSGCRAKALGSQDLGSTARSIGFVEVQYTNLLYLNPRGLGRGHARYCAEGLSSKAWRRGSSLGFSRCRLEVCGLGFPMQGLGSTQILGSWART